jgi:hypothetical protein
MAMFLVSAGPKEQEDWRWTGGVGTESCGSLLQALREGPYDKRVVEDGEEMYPKAAVFAEWILAFVSGYGAGRGKLLPDHDRASLIEWVKSYCEKNPLKVVAFAAHLLAHEVETQAKP